MDLTGTIMVVEDDSDIREAVAESLEDQGYSCVSFSGGEAALEHLRGGGALPDLILVDVRMPTMTGEELVERLSCEAGWSDVPVVMMTAHSSDYSPSQGAAARAVGILHKPIRLDELLAAIERGLRARSRR